MKDWKLLLTILLTAVAGAAPSVGPMLKIDGEVISTIVVVAMTIVRQLGVATPSKTEKQLQEENDRLKELK